MQRLKIALGIVAFLAFATLFVGGWSVGIREQERQRVEFIQSVYDSGYQAGLSGASAESNPYRGETSLLVDRTRVAKTWLDGWSAGRREVEDRQ